MRRFLVLVAFVFACGSNPQSIPDAPPHHIDAAIDAAGSGSNPGSDTGSGSGSNAFAMESTPHDRGLDLTVLALGIVIAVPTARRRKRA